MSRVYVVSTGRTATMSVANAINAVASVPAQHESVGGARLLSNLRWDRAAEDEEIRHCLEIELSQLPDPSVEVNCLLWNLIDWIAEMEPGSRFVWIVREPESTIRSMFNTGWGWPRGERGRGGRPLTGFHDPWAERFNDEQRAENCATAYAIRMMQIETALQKLDPAHWMRVPYEGLRERLNAISDFIAESLDTVVMPIQDLPHDNASRQRDMPPEQLALVRRAVAQNQALAQWSANAHY